MESSRGEGARLRVAAHLTADDARRVLDLAEDAARADGAHPLSEHVVLHLRHGTDDALHMLVEDPTTTELLGYAHLDCIDEVDGPAAELAVSPAARRRGVGTLLLDELIRRADEHPGHLRLWAHGAGAAANELAAANGFHRVRRLWQMRRSLLGPLDPIAMPAGMSLRSFDATRDIPAWLALNAAAFTDLPDQGGWTRADLEQRMSEPWFDPDGFLIAEDPDGAMVGFHWTKVHGHGHGHHGHDPLDGAADTHTPGAHPTRGGHAHDPIGEVYIVGVDPARRGLGLGRSLTLAGLHHLRRAGLTAALLYVDADNAAAIALYRALGFGAWDSDTLFGR